MSAMKEISSTRELELLLKEPLAVIFKHSTRCPISAAAHSEMRNFAAKHPEIPVFLVRVIENREVSNHVSQILDLKHESPQALVVRSGKLTWYASHYQISEEALGRQTT